MASISSSYFQYSASAPGNIESVDALLDAVQKTDSMTKAMDIFHSYTPPVQAKCDPELWNAQQDIKKTWTRMAQTLQEKGIGCPAPGASFREIEAFFRSAANQDALDAIETLDLSHLDLTALPTQLKKCRCLNELDLSQNPKLRLLPEWITEYKSLEVLHIQGTRIPVLPSWLSECEQLHSISVSSRLKGNIPDVLQQKIDDDELAFFGYRPGDEAQPFQFSQERDSGTSQWFQKIKQQLPRHRLEEMGLIRSARRVTKPN